mgnify:CR=1 FL=1
MGSAITRRLRELTFRFNVASAGNAVDHATIDGDEAAMAKALADALRPYSRTVTVRGGMLGSQAIDAAQLTRLATLPSRDVLLGKLAGGMGRALRPPPRPTTLAQEMREGLERFGGPARLLVAERDRTASECDPVSQERDLKEQGRA